MKLRFDCRTPGCPALIEYRPTGQGVETLVCPRCARDYEVTSTDSLVRGLLPDHCPMCQGREFYKRKSFPQKTGLVIVVAAAGLSLYFLKRSALVAYGVLVAAAVVDLAIYYFIGVVSVCYRCRTEYWSIANNRDQEWFDLPTSEKYL